METYQLILLVFIGLIIILRVKRYFETRSMNNYTASEVKKLMKENSNIVLVDVRTEKERKAGHIKHSIHVPLYEISTKPDQLKKYQSRELICYCQTGSRSVSAALKLKKMGFDAANMKGGFITW